jgi:hypothetical protein
MASGHVARWRDRSGKGNDARQDDTTAQPTVSSSWHNGLPAVKFDGATQFLQLPQVFQSFGQGLSIFVVGDVSNAPLCPSFVQLSNGGETDDISLHIEADNDVGYEVLNDYLVTNPGTALPGQPLWLGVIHKPNEDVAMYVAGSVSLQGTMRLPADVPRAIDDIGRTGYSGCEPLNGHVAELIIYLRALDEGERHLVDAYLKGKWSL